MDRVLVAPRRDKADARALFLDDGIGADGGAVRQERDVAAELAEVHAERLRAGPQGVHHAEGEVGRGRGDLGGQEPPAAVDDGAVGEGAAYVYANEVGHGALRSEEHTLN